MRKNNKGLLNANDYILLNGDLLRQLLWLFASIGSPRKECSTNTK